MSRIDSAEQWSDGPPGCGDATRRRHLISPKHEWPRGGGTIEKNRSVRHSVKLSIGEQHARVKLLEEISLPSLLKRNFSSTTGRMDPTGFEPASATVTECRVPLTLRALIGVSGVAENMARLAERNILERVPNWEVFGRQGAFNTGAKQILCAMIGVFDRQRTYWQFCRAPPD